jgi:AraC-like DNA-binding protein
MVALRGIFEPILEPCVEEILDRFSSLFGIRIAFFSRTGEDLKVGQNRGNSVYCMLLREWLFGDSVCLALDALKRDEAARIGNLICYECHGGLMEAIKPVHYKNILLGYAMIGQFRTRKDLPKSVADGWLVKNRDLRELRSAYRQLPFVGQNRLEDILAFFSMIVDHVVTQHMISIKGDLLLEELLTYMEEHIGENISLSDASAFAHRSVSTVTHAFRERLGKSFKEVLIEMKLQKAEEFLSSDPNATVSAAARGVGYNAPLYFSRLYKKVRGIPPSKYRR